MRNFLIIVGKIMLGSVWIFLALLTNLLGYGIYKSIGRVQTQTDAGEFLSPNSAVLYYILFVPCALYLVLVTNWFRSLKWPNFTSHYSKS